MILMYSPRQLGRPTALFVALVALAACSGPQRNKDAGLLGYGTPGVSTFGREMPASTLQEELDRCSRVSQTEAVSQTQGLPAACAQLHRTVRNQPGNTLQSARTP